MYLGQPGLGVAMLFTFGFCGFGQVLDILLLPSALNQANRRLGFLKSEAAVTVSTAPTSVLDPYSVAEPVSSAKDDELDRLLRQAQQSVSRTNRIEEDS